MKHATLPLSVILLTIALFTNISAQAEDEEILDPSRPSISENAQAPKKGVVQVEYGVDLDFATPEYRDKQSGPLGIFIGASDRLRLDLEFDTFVTQKERGGPRQTGVGDVRLGFKAIARDKPDERLGVAFAYSVKLPAASEAKGLGTGRVDHTARLILNRKYDKNDFTVNFSYLNVGRDDSERRASGAQVAFAYERELTKKFSLLTEYYGNSVDERQPRGLYALGAILYKPNKKMQVDFGVRPGFGREAPNFNAFVGITVGFPGVFR